MQLRPSIYASSVTNRSHIMYVTIYVIILLDMDHDNSSVFCDANMSHHFYCSMYCSKMIVVLRLVTVFTMHLATLLKAHIHLSHNLSVVVRTLPPCWAQR